MMIYLIVMQVFGLGVIDNIDNNDKSNGYDYGN